MIYVVYKKVDSVEAKWKALADTTVVAYPFIAKTFGAYPYKNYSFIQGGDGGMEYPMATLIKNFSIGTAIHEWMHSWFQGMMGTNESLYPWMDEGFTTYAELRTSAWLRRDTTAFPFTNAYDSYFRLAKVKWKNQWQPTRSLQHQLCLLFRGVFKRRCVYGTAWLYRRRQSA